MPPCIRQRPPQIFGPNPAGIAPLAGHLTYRNVEEHIGTQPILAQHHYHSIALSKGVDDQLFQFLLRTTYQIRAYVYHQNLLLLPKGAYTGREAAKQDAKRHFCSIKALVEYGLISSKFSFLVPWYLKHSISIHRLSSTIM